MPTLQYPNNPNTDTAFVVQDDGVTKNRALMIAPQDISTLELPNNSNSTKGYVTIDGKKQRVVLTADISGAGGGGLPSQTGNAGKFLITDGTDASWGNKLTHLGITSANSSSLYDIWKYTNGGTNSLILSYTDLFPSTNPLGWTFRWTTGNNQAFYYENNINGTSYVAHPTIGISTRKFENVYTTTINNGSDITVPSVGGTLALQIATLPTAGSTYEGTIYQFTGTTDSTYTNGHFYKCVSDGQTPATYSWEEISFGGGGNYLSNTATGTDSLAVNEVPYGTSVPHTTGNNSLVIGGYATTSNNVVSIGYKNGNGQDYAGSAVLVGTYCSVKGYGGIAIGSFAKAHTYGVSMGESSEAYDNGIAIGRYAIAQAQKAIQLGQGTNSAANTFKVSNANGNFEMMSADGTIPADRLASTTGLADGNYRLRLTMANGVPTLSWVAE